jgi:hypothetical protein
LINENINKKINDVFPNFLILEKALYIELIELINDILLNSLDYYSILIILFNEIKEKINILEFNKFGYLDTGNLYNNNLMREKFDDLMIKKSLLSEKFDRLDIIIQELEKN